MTPSGRPGEYQSARHEGTPATPTPRPEGELRRARRDADPARPAPAAVATPAHFSWPLRVYYEDTDAAGVVYYANYLRFLERARTEWLIALEHSPARLAQSDGVAFVVRRVEVDYRRPARLAEALEVTVRVVAQRRATVELAQDVLRDGEPLVRARVELACVDARSWHPARIPPALAASLEALR